MALSPGSRLAQYEILSPLGAGGMGEVYRARDTRLGREVAVKILPVLHGSDSSLLQRFTREAALASALNHPNIVTVHEIGDSDSGSFIVMELIVGQTLRGARESYSSPERVIHVAVQVARALAVAHSAGIVHRDLKPDNIMVREDGYVKLLDFGLATESAYTGPEDPTVVALTSPGEILGTVPYMSPEQARGESLGAASDIFSLGVVLYELLAHRHPFRSASAAATMNAILASAVSPPSQEEPAVPPELDSLILRMLEKNAAMRPSAAELAEELESLAAGKIPAAPRRGSGTAPPRPLAGRGRERADMASAFEAAAAGRGSLLCLAGEAGQGKTTLAEDFLSRLPGQSADCLIARGRCSERLAGSDACLPFLEALEGLHRMGGISGRLLATLAPTWFAQIASGKFLPDGTSPERLKWEIGRYLDELSKHRPVVLFLDDLHWAGVATVDLIAYLGTRLGSLRILMVATYRPGDLLRDRHPFLQVRLDLEGRGLCREIHAELLQRSAVEEYLQLAFPGHAFPKSFAASIHDRTEGHPLFMVDLLKYLRDRGAIASTDGVWTLRDFAGEFERDLPASVRSMIERKIGQIPEADRKLLDAAGVQGHEFDSAVVARVLGVPADDVEERLDALENVYAIVRQVEMKELPDRTLTLRYRFVHVLYQNALYAALRPTRKATLSAAVAKALLEFHAGRTEALASELALLFEAARDFRTAVDYFEIAARNAVRLFANREAVEFLRSALRLLNTLPPGPERDSREFALQAALGPPLVVTRGYASPETAESYTRAWDLCRGLGKTAAHFDVLFGMWNYHEVSGRLHVARELANELLALAEEGGEASRLLLAHRAVANVALWTGDPRRAKVHFEKALTFYLPEFHREATRTGVAPGMGCMGMLGWTEWFLGNSAEALRCVEKQLEMAREISHPFTTAISLVDASFLHQFRGDHAAVREASEALMRLAAEEGFALWQAGSLVMHGWAKFHLGEPETGLAEMRQGIERWHATGAEVASTYFLSLLAASQGLAGDTAGGLVTVDAALLRASETGENCWKPELLLVKGDLLAASQPAEANAARRAAFELARLTGAKAFERHAAERLGDDLPNVLRAARGAD